MVSRRWIALLCFALMPVVGVAQSVEVVLKDKLDGNLNGYCLDIVGGGENANVDNGLQAHTCYSYRGDLGIDQAMDAKAVSQGKFFIPGFDVCALVASHEEGQKVALATCDGSAPQQFIFADNGNISPKAAPGMCLTAGEETSFGRGGTSPHQIKALTLQACSEGLTGYQQWYARTQAQYDAEQGE